jgi:hypothetical protein
MSDKDDVLKLIDHIDKVEQRLLAKIDSLKSFKDRSVGAWVGLVGVAGVAGALAGLLVAWYK